MAPESQGHSCCGGSPAEIHQTRTILGLCARALGNPPMYCRLVTETDAFNRWDALALEAEDEGMGPLLYHHLKEVDALMPFQARRTLAAVTVRHRHANAVRANALSEILHAYQAEGIEALVLKGAALANLVYPQPEMRPMRDVDILVKEADAPRAQAQLGKLGFTLQPNLSEMSWAKHPHLYPMERCEAGMTVSVEIHHRLFPKTRYHRRIGLEDLASEAITFQIGEVCARTLGVEDMLWHVYRHACGPPLLASPLRLIWIADLVSLVDRFHAQIDWEKLRRKYPQVVHALPLLHFVTPWEENALKQLPFAIPAKPEGVGQEFQGWPRSSRARRRKLGLWKTMVETMDPPEWWLRFFYGVGGEGSWLWTRWVRHPFHLLEWAGHYIKEDLVKRLSTRRGTDSAEVIHLDEK